MLRCSSKHATESEDVQDVISEAAFADIATTPVNNENWQQPVLNASPSGITPEMLAQVPGWTADVIEQYMAQGWSFEQLSRLPRTSCPTCTRRATLKQDLGETVAIAMEIRSSNPVLSNKFLEQPDRQRPDDGRRFHEENRLPALLDHRLGLDNQPCCA